MLKLKKVYICDMCGKVDLPVRSFNNAGLFFMPDNWYKRGQFDVYLKLKRDEKEGAENE